MINCCARYFVYLASKEAAPEDWEAASAGALWICNMEARPPLIPQNIVNAIDGGGFMPGTLLNLEWSEQENAPDSAELGFEKMMVTYGVTYEGCTNGALESMAGGSVLLLTDRAGEFEGRQDLVTVDFR